MYNFDRNTKTIQEIHSGYNKGLIVIDRTYQRRKVWNDEDKVRLIETILLGLVMPEVYFWPADINPDNGETITHIVDGQQRITTIMDFLSGDFCLIEKYLMDESIKSTYSNKKFSELDAETKKMIWQYKIAIVNIDRTCSREIIKKLFYRLNLTTYNLNSQEKRNSLDSVFGDKCEALSRLDFWEKIKVFSATDAKRMLDVEYCCSIYILANEGIVDQTRGIKINDYYDDYKDSFDEDKSLENKIIQAMDLIKELLDKTTASFVSKKAQLYTLFCVAFKFIDNSIKMEETIFNRFKAFVVLYNNFRNDFEYTTDKPKLNALIESIKKYKLAASEGVNKVGNRVIRFETLYKICVDNTVSILECFDEANQLLSDKLQNNIYKFEKFEADDVPTEE